jgi:hypothetical protein
MISFTNAFLSGSTKSIGYCYFLCVCLLKWKDISTVSNNEGIVAQSSKIIFSWQPICVMSTSMCFCCISAEALCTWH